VPELPHIIELRRAEGGIRAWQAEPGEYYHQLDGQYGGLWRRNRRPPQMLAGVGFSGQGKFEGTYYRRLPASYDPDYAWIFAGVDGDIIGDYGLSGGGAAGFELDRADPVLGTPANAAILARSENPPRRSSPCRKSSLASAHRQRRRTGRADARRNRLFRHGSGGAVFAVGSITFCGSLWNPAPPTAASGPSLACWRMSFANSRGKDAYSAATNSAPCPEHSHGAKARSLVLALPGAATSWRHPNGSRETGSDRNCCCLRMLNQSGVGGAVQMSARRR
jgi:hypothetical protein